MRYYSSPAQLQRLLACLSADAEPELFAKLQVCLLYSLSFTVVLLCTLFMSVA